MYFIYTSSSSVLGLTTTIELVVGDMDYRWRLWETLDYGEYKWNKQIHLERLMKNSLTIWI